jgi:ribosome biogenesis GTPase
VRQRNASTLQGYGWGPFFENQLTPEERAERDSVVGRILEEHRRMYRVVTERAVRWGELPGRFYYDLVASGARPAVGDWVVLESATTGDRARIKRVLERRTKFSRNASGEEKAEQVVAANIDVAFLVTSLNQELNLRRLERYLALVAVSGARPVILLTKADLVPSPDEHLRAIAAIAPGVPVHAISARMNQGVEQLEQYLTPGSTAVLLGSSGVGKSTLLNRLVGDEVQATQEVRERDARGRHTTTARRLLRLPGGANLIDTPGMREVQLWEAEEGVEHTFADVVAFAERCRFRDCSHEKEPDCAVQAAVDNGDVPRERVEAYRKLLREIDAQNRKQDKAQGAKEKKRVKKLERAFFRDFKKS